MWHTLKEKSSDVLQELLKQPIANVSDSEWLMKFLWKPDYLSVLTIYSENGQYFPISSKTLQQLPTKQAPTTAGAVYDVHLGLSCENKLYLLWANEPTNHFTPKAINLFIHHKVEIFLSNGEVGYQLEDRESMLLYAAISCAQIEFEISECIKTYNGTAPENKHLAALVDNLALIKANYQKNLNHYLHQVNKDIQQSDKVDKEELPYPII